MTTRRNGQQGRRPPEATPPPALPGRRLRAPAGRAARTAALVLLSLLAAAGCGSRDAREEVVATANGETIKVAELREVLGIRNGLLPADGIPVERKRQALDRLVAGRLLAQDARGRGIDNTAEFREMIRQNETPALILALLRKESAARTRPDAGAIKAEAQKIREADNTVTEDASKAQASRNLIDRMLLQMEQDLVAAARKEFPFQVDPAAAERIARGETIGDDAVLGTAAGAPVRYGELKRYLTNLPAGPHGGTDVSRDPGAVSRILERELVGRALAAYARKQGIEGTEWMKGVRADMERSLLIDLLAQKEIFKDLAVTEGDIRLAYEQHGAMFVRDGKKIPLPRVKGQIRGFLENEKRRQALDAYVEKLRKTAKISIEEAVLPKV